MSSKTVPANSFHPTTRTRWRAWLARHHTRGEGVWLIIWKDSTGKPRVAYDDAVTEALCFGWIDSKPNKLDDERTMLWFAPRKRGAKWSALNKKRAERAMAEGLMAPAGLAKVEEARRDGSWEALDQVEALQVPPDLRQALAARGAAAQHFEAFPRSVKRGILEWILQARRPETRSRRVQETADLAAQNRRANQWRDKQGEKRG